MSGTLLEVHNLTKAFGGVRALDGLEFQLDRGELHCLIGPNGAGKSTFFSVVMGLHTPDRGRILFDGHDVTSVPPYRRVRLGMSLKFQTARIYRNLSVAENLRIPWRGEERGLNLVSWAIAELGLADCGHLAVRELPHAQQQWLEICMALVPQPTLLLLDEPTAGMTAEETQETARFLLALNDRGVALLVVEHDMDFVRQLGARVSVLHRGRLFASGPVAEIERHPGVQRIYLGEEVHV